MGRAGATLWCVSMLGAVNITPKQRLPLVATAPGPSQFPPTPRFSGTMKFLLTRDLCSGRVSTGTAEGPSGSAVIPLRSFPQLLPWPLGFGSPCSWPSAGPCVSWGKGKSSWLSRYWQSTYCVLSSAWAGIQRGAPLGTGSRGQRPGAVTRSSGNRRGAQRAQAPGTHRPKALWGRDCRFLM